MTQVIKEIAQAIKAEIKEEEEALPLSLDEYTYSEGIGRIQAYKIVLGMIPEE
jgi:hypothetical protein